MGSYLSVPYRTSVWTHLRGACVAVDNRAITMHCGKPLLFRTVIFAALVGACVGAPIFSIPLNANGQEVALEHFEGADAQEEARAFCGRHGLNAEQYVPQLVGLIQEKLKSSEQQQQQQNKVLFELPLNLNGKQLSLQFVDGQTALEATLKFCQAHGLGADPNLKTYIEQIQRLVQAKLSEVQAQAQQTQQTSSQQTQGGGDAGSGAQPVTPLFSLPITLNETLHDLVYYEGQEPQAAAREFCTAKWATIQTNLDGQQQEVELNECIGFLEETITAVRSKLLDEDVFGADASAAPTATAAAS